MSALHLAHLFALGLFGGLALAELVLEAGARTPEGERVAAILHHRLDLFLEAPILIVILATGGALVTRVPITPLLAVKLAAALIAIAANLICVAFVVARRRAVGDEARVARLSHAIRWTGLGFPFALAALVIGLGWFA